MFFLISKLEKGIPGFVCLKLKCFIVCQLARDFKLFNARFNIYTTSLIEEDNEVMFTNSLNEAYGTNVLT